MANIELNRALQILARIVVMSATLLAVTGCGRLDRGIAGWTGKGAETCVDGVLYLQFTSGVTVKYKPDGTVATCGRAR